MDPYIGQIALVAFNFAPVGWAFCNGQLLPISDYDALFALIGTTYGGDGQTTFALPDLQSRIPIHQGQGTGLSPYVMGQSDGTETVSLTADALPSHGHQAQGVSGSSNSGNPAQRRLGEGDGRYTLQGQHGRGRQHGGGRDRAGGREPAASQHHALPGAQLRHRPAGDLPVAELIGPTWACLAG